MREIKFRCFYAGLMAYRLPSIEFCESGVENIFINWDDKDDSKVADTWTGNDDYVLMQYTGLKDKNGTEIYEGDIVLHRLDHEEHPRKAVIKFKYGRFDIFEGATNSLNLSHKIYVEVIGNIYENPELAEEL